MTDSVTVKLSKPITHNGEEISELAFHEATVGDMIAADGAKGDFEKTAAILASMAGVPLEGFKKLAVRDLNKITKATAGFLETSICQRTVAPSSSPSGTPLLDLHQRGRGYANQKSSTLAQ